MPYSKQDLDSYIHSIPSYPNAFKGRGIAISAGGAYLASAYIAIRSLRATGCNLPIELWHIGPQELPPILYPTFELHGVTCIDSMVVLKDRYPGKIGGWQNKAFSVLYSSFEEVFSFDADNVAFKNPEFLFDTNEYLQHGQIFWPDFKFDSANEWTIKPFAWTFLELSPMKGAELESGQLLINKKLCWRPLMTCIHMNVESEFYYSKCTYGDKDLYRLAWEYLSTSPYVIPYRPKMLEDMVRIQYAPDGSDLFQHSRKWVLPVQKNPIRQSYRMEKECRQWLSEFEEVLRTFGIVFA